MQERILRINTAWFPLAWVSWQEAVSLHARDLVSWSFGENFKTVLGGYSKTGNRTALTLQSVLACRGRVVQQSTRPGLSNSTLFRRDHYLCLYCGQKFSASDLSRDHVHPVSRGGEDDWNNVVTACKRCNARKGNRLLAETSLALLALPYRPNHAEYLALSHSGRILGDQMTFLKGQFSANGRRMEALDVH